MADAMLGRLARWLRLLGYDTAYEAHIEDAALVGRAVREQRILLTRDHRLIIERRPGPHLLIESDNSLRQLSQVFWDLNLPRADVSHARCTECNEPLIDASPAEVAGRVPPYVAARLTAFHVCPACDRVYWEGTHMERMRRAIRRALAS